MFRLFAIVAVVARLGARGCTVSEDAFALG
jgi:hypothetical protein